MKSQVNEVVLVLYVVMGVSSAPSTQVMFK